MALETHPEGLKGMDQDNLSRVMGIKVEIKKAKDAMIEWVVGVKVQARKKNKGLEFFLKRQRKGYEDQLGLKLEQQPFPCNSDKRLVGYFNDANKSTSLRIPS